MEPALSADTARIRAVKELLPKGGGGSGTLGGGPWHPWEIYSRAAERAPGPITGLEFGLRYQPEHSGAVGASAAAMDTLGDTLGLYIRNFGKLMSGGRLVLNMNDARAVLAYVHSCDFCQFDEAFVLGAMTSTVRLAGGDTAVTETVLRADRATAARAGHIIDRQTRAGRNTAIAFDVSTLDRPMPGADPALADALRRALDHIPTAPVNDDVLVRLREDIAFAVASGTATTLETHATSLGIAPRSLQRRLAETGLQLSQMRDAAREDEACRMLATTDLTMVEIGERLGFRSTGAFFRAFRRWRGCSPGRYRRDNQGPS